jgi:hypothetical protein
VQIIAAFNDLAALGLTVDDVRDDLDLHGPALYPEPGTRAPGPPPNPAPDAVAKRRAAFKGLVSYMDVQMDRLMEHVDWSNTYMVFVGDNGTQGGGPVFSVIEPPNDTFKSKATVYRNGREVPMVFAGPGNLKDAWRNDLVNVTDLYATVLDLIGVRQPNNTKASSYSFARALEGGKSKRQVNVSELFPATRTVGGLNDMGAGPVGLGRPFGTGARAVGNDRFSLLAFNRVDEDNLFVCLPGSTALPDNDCLNEATGVYEHVVDLEFYDLEDDPFEMNPLLLGELTGQQNAAFSQLCASLNQISRNANYYMNGKDVCNPNGEQIR